jgi:UDP-hydrolysing UDP-N-acetyl-D-glucosamine 2-epimerase
MKVLIISGSRSDRNGLDAVHDALVGRGHTAVMFQITHLEKTKDTCVDALAIMRHYGEGLDLAIVAGDRYEIVIAALMCTIIKLPIAHIAGGDITSGSADNKYRDAITAMADFHLATNSRAYARLCSMVEYSDQIYLAGSPALDLIDRTPIMTKEEIFSCVGIEPAKCNLLVSVHPNTMPGVDHALEAEQILLALGSYDDLAVIFLGANGDPGGRDINDMLRATPAGKSKRVFFNNLSPSMYFSLMTHVDAMVGNSSAGFYEAPCFGLPVVNVGDRQTGRLIPENVINVPANAAAIRSGIIIATAMGHTPTFNPYKHEGNCADAIVRYLEIWKNHAQPQSVGRRS